MTQLTRSADGYNDCTLMDTGLRDRIVGVDMALLVGRTNQNTGSARQWLGSWVELCPDGSLGRTITLHNYHSDLEARNATSPHTDTIKVRLGLGSPSYRYLCQ